MARSLDSLVLNYLSKLGGHETIAATELASSLGVSAFSLALMLEDLHDRGLVNRINEQIPGVPVRWRLTAPIMMPASSSNESSIRIVVLVDLGNTHDCLAKLVPLAEAGVLKVRAYADCKYSGFGVRPPLVATNCTVVQADGTDRNAADVELIWDVARMCFAPGPTEGYIFIVATKDLGFLHLKRCVETLKRHSLRFVSNWSTLEAALSTVA